jgi:DNA-binding CsgD family transcriptional regulator
MISSAAWARAAEQVVAVCERGGDAMALRLELVGLLRRVVGFDAYAFLLTDPQTSVGSAPLAEVPCLPELPRLIRCKYLTDINRWTTVNDVALLQQATAGQPARSLVWREVLARYDVGDVASLVFRDRFGCWGFLDLWRSGTSARFDAEEARFLRGTTGPVAAALRRAQASTFTVDVSRRSRAGPVVLVLSGDLDVLGQTPDTHEYLRVLVPPTGERSPIPASVYNVAAQLLAVEAGIDANPPTARVHLSNGLWLTLRAAALGDGPPAPGRNIAVSIEECSPDERLSMFVRAFGLTARESELVQHLVPGRDTREVARRMFLSEHTVQDHLKSIFTKTATRSRPTLVSRALGS